MSASDREASFEQIVLPHLEAGYKLARWVLRNDHDAEDVMQEAMVRAFRFFDGFSGTLASHVLRTHRPGSRRLQRHAGASTGFAGSSGSDESEN